MHVLPDGNVLYAGGEEIDGNLVPQNLPGRVLLADYNNGGQWQWHPETFESAITGGSAVMFAPGQILKTGGPRTDEDAVELVGSLADERSEVIDFSQVGGSVGNDYDDVDQFTLTGDRIPRPRCSGGIGSTMFGPRLLAPTQCPTPRVSRAVCGRCSGAI